jgi:hypothetical protein
MTSGKQLRGVYRFECVRPKNAQRNTWPYANMTCSIRIKQHHSQRFTCLSAARIPLDFFTSWAKCWFDELMFHIYAEIDALMVGVLRSTMMSWCQRCCVNTVQSTSMCWCIIVDIDALMSLDVDVLMRCCQRWRLMCCCQRWCVNVWCVGVVLSSTHQHINWHQHINTSTQCHQHTPSSTTTPLQHINTSTVINSSHHFNIQHSHQLTTPLQHINLHIHTVINSPHHFNLSTQSSIPRHFNTLTLPLQHFKTSSAHQHNISAHRHTAHPNTQRHWWLGWE